MRRRYKPTCHQPCQLDKAEQRANDPTHVSNLEKDAAHQHLKVTKGRNKTTYQATTNACLTEKHEGTVWDTLGRCLSLKFTQIIIDTGKQTHLGWLSIVMALELGRPIPKDGECSFPYYLYEIYGMLLGSLATRINGGLGSELVLAMIMLIFFETEQHGCPEPAIQHLRGMEALISLRKTHVEKLDNISQQLDHYALTVAEVIRSTISARTEFHPQCPEHPSSLFTWNVCVDNRPQLAHLRDYVARILEVIRIETLLTTNWLLEPEDRL